jgi:DNA repair protein RadD
MNALPSGLRPYQHVLAADILRAFNGGARSVLAASPTGSGKTVLFAALVAKIAAAGKRIVIIAHRIEIIEHITGALARWVFHRLQEIGGGYGA